MQQAQSDMSNELNAAKKCIDSLNMTLVNAKKTIEEKSMQFANEHAQHEDALKMIDSVRNFWSNCALMSHYPEQLRNDFNEAQESAMSNELAYLDAMKARDREVHTALLFLINN